MSYLMFFMGCLRGDHWRLLHACQGYHFWPCRRTVVLHLHELLFDFVETIFQRRIGYRRRRGGVGSGDHIGDLPQLLHLLFERFLQLIDMCCNRRKSCIRGLRMRQCSNHRGLGSYSVQRSRWGWKICRLGGHWYGWPDRRICHPGKRRRRWR